MGPTPTPAAEAVLDRALLQLHATDAEFDEPPYEGLTNHGPMAVEALVAMQQADAVPGFLAGYVPRLRPAVPGQPLRPEARAAALGDPARSADWTSTYEQSIAREGPAAVVAREIRALADGVIAGALHALLRTGHALRALGRRDDPVRRRELAHGLGYWAANHQALPGQLGAHAVPGRDVRTMLRELPRMPAAKRDGLITERVHQIHQLDGFVAAIEAVDLEALDFDDTVTAMVDASAHLYLTTPSSRFVYLHGVTGSSMLRVVAPWLDDDGRRALLRGTVHALAVLHAIHADDRSRLEGELPAVGFDPLALARAAAHSGDDHTIKLVEAVLREHEHAPRTVLLHMAQHRVAA